MCVRITHPDVALPITNCIYCRYPDVGGKRAALKYLKRN